MKFDSSQRTKVTFTVMLAILVGGCLYYTFKSNVAKNKSKKTSNLDDDNNKTTSSLGTNESQGVLVSNTTNTTTKIEIKNGLTKTTEIKSESISIASLSIKKKDAKNDKNCKNKSVSGDTLIIQANILNYNIKIQNVFNRFTHGLRFGKCETQGARERMENVSDYIKDFNTCYNGKTPSFCFLLFDGHAGVECAEQCKKNLAKIIAKELKIYQKSILYVDPNANLTTTTPINNTGIKQDPNKDINVDKDNKKDKDDKNNDDQIGGFDDINNDPICQSIKNGFIKMDKKFREYAQKSKSVAGAVGVFILLIDDVLYVANIGDTRAVLSREGCPVGLTVDHTPTNKEECKRAKEYIDAKTQRLNGELAVTRAFGDYMFTDNAENNTEAGECCTKMNGLTCEPHIKKIKLTKKDEFCIVACDGLWDVMNNRDAVQTVRRQLRRHQDCTEAADKLVKIALKSNTTDNVSAMVIGFGNKNKKNGELQIVKPTRSFAGSRLRSRRKLKI